MFWYYAASAKRRLDLILGHQRYFLTLPSAATGIPDIVSYRNTYWKSTKLIPFIFKIHVFLNNRNSKLSDLNKKRKRKNR